MPVELAEGEDLEFRVELEFSEVRDGMEGSAEEDSDGGMGTRGYCAGAS